MISFFARNDIATNILMVAILIVAGWFALEKIPYEIQPNEVFQEVRVNISYRGGSPADVERDVAIPVEQALEGLAGVKRLRTESNRGGCEIEVEAKDGVDPKELLEEVKARVDQVNTFPSEIERPRYRVPATEEWREVITIAVVGDLSEHDLLEASRLVRDQVAALPGVSNAKIAGNSPAEISIEAKPDRLLHFGLSLSNITDAIRRSSIDLPAGQVQTPGGSVLIRTTGQAYSREQFEDIVLRSRDGAEIRLGDVATVKDGFEENQKIVRFNGVPCLLVEVYRIGDQNALEIADVVKGYVKSSASRLPSGVHLSIWDDDSQALRGRLSTLIKSLVQGALLVLVVLGLFLRPTLALWILLGIPVAFAGGLIFMPILGTTINMMSLFGFIIVLGIVVDDAIVTGENIYTKLREGLEPTDAAIMGTKEVSTPVTFGIITTIVAFIPLMFMPDSWASYTKPILPVVAPVLLFSLIESKLILPSHLKHLKTNRNTTRLNWFERFQQKISRSLEFFVEKVFQPILNLCLHYRYAAVSLFAAIAIAFVGYWKGGHLGFVSLPSIDRDMINAWVELPRDTPIEETDKMVARMYQAALQLQEEYSDPTTGQSLITNIITSTGGWHSRPNNDPQQGSIAFELLPPEKRAEQFSKLRNSDISDRYREIMGPIDDEVRRFNIFGEMGGGRFGEDSGRSIEVQVRGPHSPEKIAAMDQIEELFDSYRDRGITSTWHDAERGREEIQLTLKPRATELGLTQRELASQVRAAFFGEQAQRIQRERDDIRVMVRLPEEDRASLDTLDNLVLRAPNGAEIPFSAAADIKFTRSPGRLKRINGLQVNELTAQVRDDEIDVIGIARDAAPQIDKLLASTNLSWAYTGFVADDGETLRRTSLGGILLLLTLYALLAIPFKSLVQPIFVLLAIPFGIIGAMLGHIIMDQTPSWLSVFGILALTGVVVNDSLVLVDFINRRRESDMSLHEAVLQAGSRRFRPILLTSLTTFAGLMPLISERSLQAQFLKPMAISLAFGILFATFITLLLIPTAYLITEDIKRAFGSFYRWYRKPFQENRSPTKVASEESSAQ
ncbi:efflux RND transporter permease subunit [Roseibacillus persicicus]|uniref:Acriflavin resistance protein n=1 Tax=Roseibacillus persicicus TaxID=454148 RepID=A0A918WQE1_9BACT|nr:efflux RND transporter permease subunit [Roseibacillus persicicus]MDQ8188826.1 efflux RND transporter permease subunit [Roseibacillus persicicus]GHC66393.1 acriflavin resistance protein [Roseibacillus persicicus]